SSASQAVAQQAGSAKKGSIRPVQATEPELQAPAPTFKSKSTQSRAGSAQPRTNVPPRDSAADESDADGKTPPGRPKGDLTLHIEQLDPELKKILKNWEVESSKFKRLEGGFARRRYDKVFEVEFWATGKFVYESPDKGYYELAGVAPNPKARVKLNADGQ